MHLAHVVARRAFTLIELLVVLAVVVVLVALSFSGVAASRRAAIELKCRTHVAQHVFALSAYGADFQGYFPSWMGDGTAVTANPARWHAYASQGFDVMHKSRWLTYTSTSLATPTYYCPSNQFRTERKPFGTFNFDYAISDSAYIMPAYLDPSLPTGAWLGKLGARVQRDHEVLWPSAKVLTFENSVWHGWKGSAGPDSELGGLDYKSSTRPGTIGFADGHADQKRPNLPPWTLRYPHWQYGPFGMTPWGVRGRDY